MLPTRTSPRQAAGWILLHTVATAIAALLLAAHPALGWLYLFPIMAATVDLIIRNVRLLLRPGAKQALSLFKATNLYLALILLMVCVDALG